VKNVHELLAKLAWDFSPQQLDHLFECFQVRQRHSTCFCTFTGLLLCVFLSLYKQLFVVALGVHVVDTLHHNLCAKHTMLLILF